MEREYRQKLNVLELNTSRTTQAKHCPICGQNFTMAPNSNIQSVSDNGRNSTKRGSIKNPCIAKKRP